MVYFNLLKERNFCLLWSAQLLFGLGDWISSIALLIFTSKLRFSGISISIYMVLKTLPFIITGPLIGNYIDKRKPKKIILISQIMIMFNIVFILLLLYLFNYKLISINITLFFIYLFIFLNSFLAHLIKPIQQAIIPLLYNKGILKTVNSLMSISNYITLVLGPACVGFLINALGLNNIFLLNVIIFLSSTTFIAFIKIKKIPKDNLILNENLFTKYLQGWKIIKKDSVVLYYIYASLFRGIVAGVMNISFIFVADRIFVKGRDSVGLLYSSLGLGIIFGSLLIGIFKVKYNEKKLFFLAMLFNALFSIIYINSTSWHFSLIVLFTIGIYDGIIIVIFNTRIQKNFDSNNLGKIFASSQAAIMSIQLLSMIFGGIMFDMFCYKTIINIFAICTIFLHTFAYYYKHVKLAKKIGT